MIGGGGQRTKQLEMRTLDAIAEYHRVKDTNGKVTKIVKQQ